MSRMAEKWEEERQHQLELTVARAEAAHEALPESLLLSHEMIRALQHQVAELVTRLSASGPRWRERLWGFGFGILASLVASAAWPNLTKLSSFLQ
jgi:uncharacterized coiled-coil protein SlyX